VGGGVGGGSLMGWREEDSAKTVPTGTGCLSAATYTFACACSTWQTVNSLSGRYIHQADDIILYIHQADSIFTHVVKVVLGFPGVSGSFFIY
jgi:hypothetical protein